jgi:hypothetical protein
LGALDFFRQSVKQVFKSLRLLQLIPPPEELLQQMGALLLFDAQATLPE